MKTRCKERTLLSPSMKRFRKSIMAHSFVRCAQAGSNAALSTAFRHHSEAENPSCRCGNVSGKLTALQSRVAYGPWGSLPTMLRLKGCRSQMQRHHALNRCLPISYRAQICLFYNLYRAQKYLFGPPHTCKMYQDVFFLFLSIECLRCVL